MENAIESLIEDVDALTKHLGLEILRDRRGNVKIKEIKNDSENISENITDLNSVRVIDGYLYSLDNDLHKYINTGIKVSNQKGEI